ncbi:MAG: dipeptide epimerase [Planctomycetes bacterium]|nr:dipeptide epimerase [Planctomycetota bacterium]
MKLTELRSSTLRLKLSRPYSIAGGRWDHVELAMVDLVDETGRVGYGMASPAPEVTGESFEACAEELLACEIGGRLAGEVEDGAELLERARGVLRGPAARAAFDMAWFDLRAKHAGLPLLDLLGPARGGLETSITIGVKSLSETLEEAREYVARGFRILKVKIGVDVEADLERLARLREQHGARIVLRVDANQGYDLLALGKFLARSAAMEIELIEQPLPPAEDAALLRLPEHVRARLVADESVQDDADLERMILAGKPFGVVNVKLMKCGGIAEALRMAERAERAGLCLMWGCMDESVLGISAALNAAYACTATRYLDLDGSLDLAEDPFVGGFRLERGRMETVAKPGLGVELA